MSRTNHLFFFMMFFLEAISLSSYSQAVGDFGSVGGGGNWGVSATWKLWNGAAFVTLTGSAPTTADNVWITAGNPVVVEASPKLCNNLTVQTGALLWTNNALAGNLYIEVHGDILCDGQIGNGATYDQISFDIAGANVTISGTGKFDAGRIWKNTSTNATSNLFINRNVNLRSASTQIYNNLGVASYFNVTVGVADSLILVGGSAAIDGLTGTGVANQAGTFTIDGYMDVQGILYLRTTNTGVGYDCKWIVNGELRANEISAGASSGPSTKDSLIVNNGGLLKITGMPAFSTISTAFNTYNFLDGSTVEYSAFGTQTVQNSTNFGGGLLNQYFNLIISGSGTKTLVGTAAVRNNLTISDTSGSPVFSVATFNMTVGGNWTNYNQGGFTEGVAAQSVTFNGGSGTLAANTQTIDCPGGEFFNNIVLNKGGLANFWFLKMNNDVTVAKVLSFSGSDRAALDLNGHTLYLIQAGTASLAGSFDASNSRYIVSETAVGTPAYAINPSIIKWTTTAAAANYTFPFGVNGSYLPLKIAKKMTVGNIVLQGSTRRTGVSNTPWDTTTNVPFVSSMNSPYLAVASTGADSSAIDRWWDITATPSILPVDSITFTYDGLENTLLTPFRTGAIFPQNWTGTFWSDKNQTCPVCSNGVTGAGVPGTVTIYNDTIDAAPWILVGFPIRLPIELLSFTAKLNDGKVTVDWATSSETNNNYFDLEKSKDGKSFEEVGQVRGAGNSSTTHYYNLIDQQPYTGLSYYRLRQTDFDGHFVFSELASVYDNDNNSSWYIFPNPAKDYITIAKTGDDMTDVLFQLFSMEGSLLKSIQLKTKSQHVFSVDIKDYSSGIYIGKIFDDYQQQVFKIVKK